jgi:hypothetical protein
MNAPTDTCPGPPEMVTVSSRVPVGVEKLNDSCCRSRSEATTVPEPETNRESGRRPHRELRMGPSRCSSAWQSSGLLSGRDGVRGCTPGRALYSAGALIVSLTAA